MSKLILINAPKGAGKTDLVQHLKKYLSPNIILTERQCKAKLHTLTQEFFCVDPETYWHIYNTRELKERPNDNFKLSLREVAKLSRVVLGLEEILETTASNDTMASISNREAMIYVSECLCKPAFGKEYFGEARLKSMSEDEVAIDDSTGFEEELYPAIRSLGQDNLFMIRVYGRGDWEGDSRNYIKDGVIKNTVDIYNEGSLKEFLDKGLYEVKDWLK